MATSMDLSVETLSVDTKGFTLSVEQIAVRLTSANVSEVMAELTPPKGTRQVDGWLLQRGVVRFEYRKRDSASKYVYEINPKRNTLRHSLPRTSRRSSHACPVCSRVQTLSSLARPCIMWRIYDF
jgi:hypothetical protein